MLLGGGGEKLEVLGMNLPPFLLDVVLTLQIKGVL